MGWGSRDGFRLAMNGGSRASVRNNANTGTDQVKEEVHVFCPKSGGCRSKIFAVFSLGRFFGITVLQGLPCRRWTHNACLA